MSEFIQLTISDLRGGRETWRVFVLLCAPAFALGCIATAFVQP